MSNFWSYTFWISISNLNFVSSAIIFGQFNWYCGLNIPREGSDLIELFLRGLVCNKRLLKNLDFITKHITFSGFWEIWPRPSKNTKCLVKSLLHHMHISRPYVWSTHLQGASDCNSNGLWNAYSCLEYGECQ